MNNQQTLTVYLLCAIHYEHHLSEEKKVEYVTHTDKCTTNNSDKICEGKKESSMRMNMYFNILCFHV